MRWYITIAAVHEYQALAGYPVENDGPSFDRAERELADLADRARLVATDEATGSQTWRVNVTLRGHRMRLEFSVSTRPRPEGPLPQLVRVRDNGARR